MKEFKSQLATGAGLGLILVSILIGLMWINKLNPSMTVNGNILGFVGGIVLIYALVGAILLIIGWWNENY